MTFTSTCNGLPISNQRHVQNISQAKAIAPGILSKVVARVVHMVYIAVASASSIMSLAWVILCRGLVCISVLSILFTVWCILSQVALDWRFFLVEQTSLMLNISNSHWFFFQWIYLPCHVDIVQDKDINIANFEWTCHRYVWLSCDQHKWVWLHLKPYLCMSMELNLSTIDFDLPRSDQNDGNFLVQSALLI